MSEKIPNKKIPASTNPSKTNSNPNTEIRKGITTSGKTKTWPKSPKSK